VRFVLRWCLTQSVCVLCVVLCRVVLVDGECVVRMV
jgi:hypothetical protein